jgi:hypothetical protein
MRCWSCQFENPPAMKFCGQCGTQLVHLCPRCGSENQPTFNFCGQCGTALTASPPPGADTAGDSAQLAHPPEAQRQGYTPPHLAEKSLRSRSALEGERRQVAVLFADMAGFTTLAESCYRDAVRSSDKRVVTCFGLKWLSMMPLVPLPWSERPWSLPFLTVLAPAKRANEAAGDGTRPR